MRILKSVPKQREFHTEYYSSIRPFRIVGNLGQLLSGASLAVAVFTLIAGGVAGVRIPFAVAVAAAVGIGLFVELANRVLVKPSLKPLVVKDQFSEDDKARKYHNTITRICRGALFAFGGTSLVLSFMGSMDTSRMIATPPPPAPLDSLNIAATEATAAIQATFSADTTVLLQPYRQRQQAAAQQFRATKAERSKIAEDYTGCANGGNKWCKKKRRAIFAEIDAAEAAYNATVATIATERGQALTNALQRRDAALTASTGKSESVTAEAKARAKAAADEAEEEATQNGYLLAFICLIGQLAFYVCYYISLVIVAGSGITEDLEPNEFAALPSVWSDLKAVVSHRSERGARRFIHYVFGERERLDKPLPYISVYPDKAIDEGDAASVMSAEGIAPELTEGDAVATSHAPGFYRAADNPYATKVSKPFTARERSTKKAPKGKDEMSVSDLKQRLKFYKKKVGEHKQNAIVQKRKTGTVKSRTANAITNNEQWVECYTELLKAKKK